MSKYGGKNAYQLPKMCGNVKLIIVGKHIEGKMRPLLSVSLKTAIFWTKKESQSLTY